MTKKIYILSSVLAVLLLAIISLLILKNRNQTPTQPNPEPEEQSSSQTENVLVDKTKTFSIVLESNPTTGYSWEAKYDESYIKLENSDYTPFPQITGVVGSGGNQNFEFSALQSGDTKIIFDYVRPWDKNNPTETKTYKVKIM